MAVAFIYSLQNLWPLSIFKYDDLRASDQLVSKLSIPENTKRFVYAVRDPESLSVIYILCVQNLSERSAIDAEFLIREIRPEAVVVQVSPAAVSEIQSEERELGSNVGDQFPTSSFEVLRRCFTDKINKDRYENVAGNLVLKEVFGTGFYGHIMAAKGVAKEVGSSFLLLETPDVLTSSRDNYSPEVDLSSKFHGFVNNLIPHNVVSVVSSSSRKFCITDDDQLRMVKVLSSYMDVALQKLGTSSSVSEAGPKDIDPGSLYQVPSFAQSFFPLLLDLHNIFVDLPSMGRALASSQKMLYDVSRGENVDAQLISEVYTFRVAVEGLRIALNNAGRIPIQSTRKLDKAKTLFSELPVEDKSSALLAHALQSQTRQFKTVVAVVDSSGLAGLRKHWGTSIPPEVEELVGQLVTYYEMDGDSNQAEKKLFSKKPMMAVGAGATAVLGVSSLSKAVPTSSLFKVLTFKLPSAVNFVLSQTHRAVAISLSKTLASSKVMAPGLAKSGINTTSILKATASAEKIRAVVHSVIASAEKTSLSAMRTAFYEIMRKRKVQPVGFLPWATFGCSVATCSGLLMHGEGIECVVESAPAATSIASLGRGIQNLHRASQNMEQTDGTRVQKAIESLMYRLRKIKMQ
ncbi:uncharacterized protein [Euphorbia lathyris]|uniref:uncharacterized protein n=1 Tax=Euphorbia lathyris TaxID=212925 RepID=UPI003313426C